MNAQPLLRIDDLCVEYPTRRGVIRAVNNVSLTIDRGETLGLVGESGCGKSTVGMTVLRLLSPPGRIASGSISFLGSDITKLSDAELQRLRGDRIAMIFQDPTATLNPIMSVGSQIAEIFRWHRPELSTADVRGRVTGLLERVGLADPDRRRKSYPHELSGGMRQRIVIACALALDPALMIADEPTTALDVTVQAQILKLMRALRAESAAGFLLISHDLGVIAEMSDRVIVMYAGAIVESGPVADVLGRPRHPYTQGLLHSRPRISSTQTALKPIPGSVPDLANLPDGCAFYARCSIADTRCLIERPILRGDAQLVACHKAK